MMNLATILLDQDHYSDAEKIYRQILDAQRDVFGPENPETLHTMELLGVTLAYEKHFPEAEGLFHEVLKTAGTAPGQTRVAASAWYNFACAAAVAGHNDEALHYLREAIDRGYGHAEEIASDGDLKSLRNDSRFAALIKQARNRAAAAQTH